MMICRAVVTRLDCSRKHPKEQYRSGKKMFLSDETEVNLYQDDHNTKCTTLSVKNGGGSVMCGYVWLPVEMDH